MKSLLNDVSFNKNKTSKHHDKTRTSTVVKSVNKLCVLDPEIK